MVSGLNSSKNRRLEEGKKLSQNEKQASKFKMEVDLSALNGKVHFADDEKFTIISNRNNESSKSNAFSSVQGGVSSYMS